jgi:TetR/AcrR family transcriptional regulator, lmrAB and yxaGH operons repressor
VLSRSRETVAPLTPDVSAREKIIPSIARVFRRFGYEAASLSLLSRETGLVRSSLYHFFPGGKEQMAAAVLDLAERHVREDFMQALAGPDTPARQVDKFIARLAEYYEDGEIGCILSSLTLHGCPPAIGARVADLTEKWIAAIAAYLAGRGDAPEQAQKKAEQAIRLIEGGLVLALATREPKRFETSLQDLRALLA